ncbi:MAG: Rho termination factor N-terminal domain-containing protein [Cyanobacteria bacterium J06638_20]
MIDRAELIRVFNKGLDALNVSDSDRHRAVAIFATELEQSLRGAAVQVANEGLAALSIRELKSRAKDAGIPRYGELKKSELVEALAGTGAALSPS